MNHTASNERTKLKKDFSGPGTTSEVIPEIDIDKALEEASCGWGTLLYIFGTFLFCCLEGADIVLLAIVGPIIKCKWGLTPLALSALQICTVSTMMIAAVLAAPAGDTFGRKPVSFVAALGVTTTGVLCGLAREYWHFVLLRVLTGFFIGVGTGPCIALSGEVIPVRCRALALSGFSLPWGIGASCAGGIAYLVLEPLGWRGFVICTSLAFSPAVVLLGVVRESPRFEYYRGNVAAAEETIRSIYWMNGNEKVKVKLKEDQAQEGGKEGGKEGGRMWRKAYKVLVETERVRDTLLILLSATWGVCGYYLMPSLLHPPHRTVLPGDTSCTYNNRALLSVCFVSLSEPLAVVHMLVLIEVYGRRKPAVGVGLLTVLFCSPLYFCLSKTYLFWCLVLLRMTISAAMLLPGIMIGECTPTVLRSFMLSLTAAWGRLGGVIGIFCAQYLSDVSVRLVVGVLQVTFLMFSLCLFAVKRETVGAKFG